VTWWFVEVSWLGWSSCLRARVTRTKTFRFREEADARAALKQYAALCGRRLAAARLFGPAELVREEAE